MWFTHEVLFTVCIKILFITPFVLSQKCYVLPQTQTSHLILSVHKPNYQIDLKASINSTNLPHLLGADFSATKKKGIKNHQSQPTTMTFWTTYETNTSKHHLGLAHIFCFQTNCLAVFDPVCWMNRFSVSNNHSYLLLHQLKYKRKQFLLLL